MSFPRIYQPISLKLHSTICLNAEASHHLARVLRKKVGDHLKLFNNSLFEYESVITKIDKKNVHIQVMSVLPCKTESPLTICLAQGIAKGDKMDFIIQKAVELGVNKIVPLLTERCNVKLDKDRTEKRLSHWHSIAVSACEQSSRCVVPEVGSVQPLIEWLPKANADYLFVLSPHVQDKLPPNLPTNASLVLLIGPEGGLSEQEVKLAIQHGFLPLNLGPRILRTETATIAAMSILQFYYGDM